jgi:hypothetical protein
MVGQAGGHTADVLPPIAVALQQPVKMPIFDGGHERLCIRKMFVFVPKLSANESASWRSL